MRGGRIKRQAEAEVESSGKTYSDMKLTKRAAGSVSEKIEFEQIQKNNGRRAGSSRRREYSQAVRERERDRRLGGEPWGAQSQARREGERGKEGKEEKK